MLATYIIKTSGKQAGNQNLHKFQVKENTVKQLIVNLSEILLTNLYAKRKC